MYFVIILFTHRYLLRFSNYKFAVETTSLPTDWFHMVIVYHNGGLTVHHVGTFEMTDSNTGGETNSPSSGRKTIGRKSADVHDAYTSMIVDELTMWNRTLTTQEIQDMY